MSLAPKWEGGKSSEPRLNRAARSYAYSNSIVVKGYILHELAHLLEMRGLLAAAQFNGIEEDPTQITTADAYRNLARLISIATNCNNRWKGVWGYTRG